MSSPRRFRQSTMAMMRTRMAGGGDGGGGGATMASLQGRVVLMLPRALLSQSDHVVRCTVTVRAVRGRVRVWSAQYLH